jgi:single-strand DNA-binding protein
MKHNDGQEVTDWFDVSVYGRQAENCGKYLVTGQRVCVEGRLEYRTWESEDGGKRSAVEVRATNVEFLSKPKGDI